MQGVQHILSDFQNAQKRYITVPSKTLTTYWMVRDLKDPYVRGTTVEQVLISAGLLNESAGTVYSWTRKQSKFFQAMVFIHSFLNCIISLRKLINSCENRIITRKQRTLW